MTEIKPRFENYDPEGAKRIMDHMSTGRGLHAYLGFRIVDIGPGTVHGQMDVREELLTPFGNLHGGVLSAFCDHLLGGVCYPVMKPGQWAATTEFKINLTAPVSKGVVDAKAEIIVMTRTMAVVRIDVYNQGRVAAVAQGTVTIRDPK